MLGDVIELSVVVKDLDEAAERFTKLFGLKVHHRGESKEFGFKNAILPTGIGHIELLQPTDPTKAVGRFLEKHGEGVYLVGFECKDVPALSPSCAETACAWTTRSPTSLGSIHVRLTALRRAPPPRDVRVAKAPLAHET